MTTNYHTPISTGAAANSSVVNSPLAQLDAELTDQGARITVVEGDMPVPSGVATEYYDGLGGYTVPAGTGAGVDGHLVQDEGVDLPQRAALNFVGAGVTVTDETGGTQVSIPGGGHTIQGEGVDLPQQSKINFTGAGVAVIDTAGATEVHIFSDGWTPDASTWSYSSADAPTFVISVNADMTSKISLGMRIKLTQTTAKYFIVTAVGAYGAGATLITVYGGTDYTLTTATITNPHYSGQKIPFGFNQNPDKWSVLLSDTTNATQATPTSNTYYNLGSLTISIPLGAWNVRYAVISDVVVTTTAVRNTTLSFALSTSASAAVELDLRVTQIAAIPIVALGGMRLLSTAQKTLSLAAKTTYYLIQFVSVGVDAVTSMAIRGDLATTIVRATSAYL